MGYWVAKIPNGTEKVKLSFNSGDYIIAEKIVSYNSTAADLEGEILPSSWSGTLTFKINMGQLDIERVTSSYTNSYRLQYGSDYLSKDCVFKNNMILAMDYDSSITISDEVAGLTYTSVHINGSQNFADYIADNSEGTGKITLCDDAGNNGYLLISNDNYVLYENSSGVQYYLAHWGSNTTASDTAYINETYTASEVYTPATL